MASSINTFLFCNAFPGDGKVLAWGACPHGSRGPRAWGPLCRWIPADLHGVRHSLSGFHLATENLWEWQIKCYEPYLNRGSRVARDAQKLSASVEPSLWLWEVLGLGEVLQGLYICSQTLVGTGGAASPVGGRCAATPVSAPCFYNKITPSSTPRP